MLNIWLLLVVGVVLLQEVTQAAGAAAAQVDLELEHLASHLVVSP
jgi:hypothetical protein